MAALGTWVPIKQRMHHCVYTGVWRAPCVELNPEPSQGAQGRRHSWKPRGGSCPPVGATQSSRRGEPARTCVFPGSLSQKLGVLPGPRSTKGVLGRGYCPLGVLRPLVPIGATVGVIGRVCGLPRDGCSLTRLPAGPRQDSPAPQCWGRVDGKRLVALRWRRRLPAPLAVRTRTSSPNPFPPTA